MRQPFFITGLPRSRTAWLANLFTTDSTLCLHEPFQKVAFLMQENPGVRLGVSDSILPFAFNDLSREFPDAPWLYVERKPEDALASWKRFIAGHFMLTDHQVTDFWNQHEEASRRMFDDSRVMRIGFDELDQDGPIECAWRYLLPGVPLNIMRWRMLRNLRVEQIIEKAKERIKPWAQL